MQLDSLNPAQREAVERADGPIMVLAGAGSGKTRTLVTRIQYLLDEKHISPFKVLAVTFSNKAAKEMRERVAAQSEVDVGALQITTFHAFCAKLLRSEATYLGLSRSFTIYDDSESLTIVKSLMAKRGISQKETSPYEIRGYFDQLKNIGHYVGRTQEYDFEQYEIDKDDLYYQMFLEYENELSRSNAVDFGGLLTGVIHLFETYPEVLERYQKRYEYVLVDEYQDTNRSQFILIYLLTQLKRNVCVVGDEDQSIYSWRGADIHNILDYEKVFPEVHTIKLEQNYRSTSTIISAASALIEKNNLRKGKSMWTDNPDGELIKVIECIDDREEANFITEKIIKLSDEGEKYQDMAIFYRNNSQSRQIEDALLKAKIPYRVVAGIRFYDRKEIKDLLSYLRIIINPKDSLAVARVINVPARGIGATSLRKMEELAISLQLSLWEVIEEIVDNYENYKNLRLSAKIRSALGEFVHVLNECKYLEQKGESPSTIYEKILHESGYYNYLRQQKNYESMARIENLDELQNAIVQYEELNQNSNLVGFLETITLDAQIEEKSTSGEVSLMTVHGSKGLEYPYVFLAGVEENIFPSYRSLEEGDDNSIEEERRLFYVAMTRAMKELYVVFARGRMLWGSVRYNGPSRFIEEIPSNFVEWKNHKGKPKAKVIDGVDYSDEYSQESFHSDFDDFGSVSEHKVISERVKFPKGAKVFHQIYGEGTVLLNDGVGKEEKVTISFRDGSKKKFMVKYSPIELI